jgi:hypothetical protein
MAVRLETSAIIAHAGWLRFRFPLSLRQIEGLLIHQPLTLCRTDTACPGVGVGDDRHIGALVQMARPIG